MRMQHREEKGKEQVRKREQQVQRPQSRTQPDWLEEFRGRPWVRKEESRKAHSPKGTEGVSLRSSLKVKDLGLS